MKKFLALLTMIAILGGSTIGCTDDKAKDKAAPAKDAKDKDAKDKKDKEKDPKPS